MTTLPAFGAQLRRLAELRGLGLGALAERAEAPALLWHARRLTAGQLDQVYERARVIRQERADELHHPCHCPRPS